MNPEYLYGDLSDQELADELEELERDIGYWQNLIGSYRKQINTAMDKKEDLIDLMKQRGQRRGWQK
jgi:hypothetical protein